MSRATLRNVVGYAIAAAFVSYAARGTSPSQIVDAGRGATLWIFVVASLGGFACWFFGEAVLYSRLFSYFHGGTKPLEVVPTIAAVYFIQIVNSYLASGALVLFLHSRKHTPWITGGCTLLFLGFVDAVLLATLSLLAIALVPTSPIRLGLPYAWGVLLVSSVIASFWLCWGARLRAGNWLRWLYDRPSMVSFRTARPSHYVGLLAIRSLIVLGAGLALHGQFVSFHVAIPLAQTLALTPLVVALGSSPFSPAGIGTTQLIFTLGFSRFAGKDDLFALSVAVTVFNVLARLPMGLAMGAPFAMDGAGGRENCR